MRATEGAGYEPGTRHRPSSTRTTGGATHRAALVETYPAVLAASRPAADTDPQREEGAEIALARTVSTSKYDYPMIKMGEITCRIPSNGIKSEILYCTEPEGYKLDQWTVSIDLVVAVLTVLLFVVAYRTLKQMKRDSAEQWKSVKKQLDSQAKLATGAAAANRKLAKEQQQMQALTGYVHAIRDLRVGHKQTIEDFSVSKTHMSIAWFTWSMFLHDGQESFLKLTQEYTGDLGKLAAHVHEINIGHQAGGVDADSYLAILDAYATFVGNYIANLGAWQASDAKKADSERAIRETLDLMRRTFKHVFSGVPA